LAPENLDAVVVGECREVAYRIHLLM
jgi:hypothetical protein